MKLVRRVTLALASIAALALAGGLYIGTLLGLAFAALALAGGAHWRVG